MKKYETLKHPEDLQPRVLINVIDTTSARVTSPGIFSKKLLLPDVWLPVPCSEETLSPLHGSSLVSLIPTAQIVTAKPSKTNK